MVYPKNPTLAAYRKPDAFVCTYAEGVNASAQSLIFTPIIWSNADNGLVQVRIRNETNHAWVSNQGVGVYWVAVWLPREE